VCSACVDGADFLPRELACREHALDFGLEFGGKVTALEDRFARGVVREGDMQNAEGCSYEIWMLVWFNFEVGWHVGSRYRFPRAFIRHQPISTTWVTSNFHNRNEVPQYTSKYYIHAFTLRLPRNVAWATSLGKHVTILHDIVQCRWCDVLDA
jgi:hypothetical protein